MMDKHIKGEDILEDPEGAEELFHMFRDRIADLEQLTQAQREQIEALMERVMRDPMLVELYNARGFRQRTQEAIERRREKKGRLATIVVDIDNFKTINDTYGHGVGDEVLRALADILLRVGRDEDIVVRRENDDGEVESSAGRLGGDEFAITLPGADEEGARKVLERIKEAVGKEVVGEGGITFSVSGGIAVYEENLDIEEMLDIADKDMYQDKKRRSGRAV